MLVNSYCIVSARSLHAKLLKLRYFAEASYRIAQTGTDALKGINIFLPHV